MTTTASLAAAGILLFVIAGAVFFFVGRKLGKRAELRRQQQARSTAEETAKRIVGEAEREAESVRKTAVLSGKEELIKLREEWEIEVRGRREEVEREERKVGDREAQCRARGEEDHRAGDPADSGRAERRSNRVSRLASERRDEGTHHRSRGQKHSRLRACHRGRRHHR